MKPEHTLGQRIAGLFASTADVGELPLTPPLSAPVATPLARRKLWHLEGKLHCPVIGTCLPLGELQRLARRFHFSAKLNDAFALHGEAVNYARERNEFSEALQKHFDQAYREPLRHFEIARSDAEVLRLWQECLGRGEVAGPLWAAVSHKHASAETRNRLYADIHMLSHQVGAGQAADTRRLTYLEREVFEQRKQRSKSLVDYARREAELRTRIDALESGEAMADCQRVRLEQLQTRLEQFESGAAMIDMGRRLMGLSLANERLLAEAERARSLEQQAAELRVALTEIRRERDDLGAERNALERLLLADGGTCADDCGECPESIASAVETGGPRRILCVGGRTQLLTQYRQLAERLGLKLSHHDGGQEEALSRLPEMIQGADAVLCPTDCVSHPAYYRLKRECKQLGKPCLLFKGAGVTSFAAALVQLHSGHATLNAASDAD
ncbi:MAG TPA: DUF2325 domain-containing protein [Rhodocyclaceae bacterium]